MICDVSAIVSNEGAQLTLDGCLDGLTIASDMELASAHIEGKITNSGGVLVLEAKVTAEVKTACARCLKEILMPVTFDFGETLVFIGQETDADADSVIFFEGKEIDIGEIAINNLLLNISSKYLCRDDCRGICPKCGKNLNEVDCGCDFFEIDPRWEKLKNFK